MGSGPRAGAFGRILGRGDPRQDREARIQQAAIELFDVRVPAGNKLALSRGFRDVSAALNRTRATVAWEALGHAQASFEIAGNGLLLERHVAHHLTDLEVLHTYEGTDFLRSLIVGREITGVAAFN